MNLAFRHISLHWIVLEGAHAGEKYELKFGSSIESVGRGEENFICLKKDEYVSEKHASLRLGDNNNSIEVKTHWSVKCIHHGGVPP